ncbi:hypothetical protein AA313_de0203182 [Arthrobotrys entomopaga]|nr:hypothetical protein AA313_de0203182 [Arthrobotrys entomopaga]
MPHRDLRNFSFQQSFSDKRRRLSLFTGAGASHSGSRSRTICRSRTPSPKSTGDRSQGYTVYRYSLKGNMVSLDDPLEDAHLVQVIRQVR